MPWLACVVVWRSSSSRGRGASSSDLQRTAAPGKTLVESRHASLLHQTGAGTPSVQKTRSGTEPTKGILPMKHQLRLPLVALLAILALGSVASASASAAACHKKAGSKRYALCVAGQEVGSPSTEGEEVLTLHIFSGTTTAYYIPGYSEKSFSDCKTANGAQGRLNSGKGQVRAVQVAISMSSCSSSWACKLKQPYTFSGLGGKFQPGSDGVSLKGEGVSGFMGETTIEGEKCPVTLLGTRIVSGEERCTVVGAESEATEHELLCLAEKKTLLRNGVENQFALDATVGLTSGKPFSVIETA
jgi:hypothetical protein